MIIQAVSFQGFCDAFRDMNRDKNFTYQGKRALFDYLENLSKRYEEPYELDVIDLCNNYTEMQFDKVITSYAYDFSIADSATDKEKYEIVKDYLLDNSSWVVEIAIGTFIFQNF